jgi:hypothetical protein
VRLPHHIARITAIVATSVLALAVLASHASAQVVEITPLPTESPSAKLAPGTQWIYWMAIGAGVIAVLILLGVASGYVRFAPKFFGREEPAKPLPPGIRPPALARQAAQMRYTPPPSAQHAAVATPAPARAATATAVAERPAPASPSSAAPAPAASAPSAATAVAPAEAATEQTTAPPSGEPAAQADAVGQAETEAPEERPTAKTAEEVGAPQAAAAAEAEATTAPTSAPEPAAAPQAPAAQAPAAQAAPPHGSGSEMDQETFDRVLKEQLDRGVDRRVAEGRARAAAVVAARKKAQA